MRAALAVSVRPFVRGASMGSGLDAAATFASSAY
jgi:hypothetical protein